MDGGRDALKLFTDRGFTAIINDDLIGYAFAITNLMVAAISMGAGAGVAYVSMPSNPDRGAIAALAGVLSLCVGFFSASIMTSILASATRTVFVCWAMNPGALLNTHPHTLNNLAAAWAEFQPQVWTSSGYAQQVIILKSGGPV